MPRGSPPAVPEVRWTLAAAGAHLLLGLLLYEPTLFPGGDNADYVILGEALRTGQGYRDLHLAGAPLHTKYPPGYPVLLAVLGSIGGLQLFKLASLVLTTGCVWLTWRLGRRAFGPRTALLAAGLLAVSPTLVEYSHWELSEAPFTFLVLAALWGGGSGRPVRRAAGVAVGMAAFLTRTAGLPLLLALSLHPLLRRRRREATLAGIASLAALVGWAFFQRLGPPGQPGYFGELLLVEPYAPEAGRVGAADLLARVATNVWLYASAVLPSALGVGRGAWPDGPNPLVVLLGASAAALALTGWLRESTRELTLHGLFTLLYLGLLAVWPAAWSDRRFLLPVLPLLLLYLVDGAEAIREWTLRRSGNGRAAAVAAAIAVALPALFSAARLAPGRVACFAAWRDGTPCDLPPMASFYAAGRWAAEHTPPDAIVASRKPSLFFLFARRPGGLYRFSAEPALVLRGLEELGATHVVVDRISATTDRYLIPAIAAHRHRFQPVYSGGEPPTWILRFDTEPRTAGRDPLAGGASGRGVGGRPGAGAGGGGSG